MGTYVQIRKKVSEIHQVWSRRPISSSSDASDREARLGGWEDPTPGLGTAYITGTKAGRTGAQLWLGRQTQVHGHWHQVRQQARLSHRCRQCAALSFLLTWHYPGHLLNTLQAKCPKVAPPDFCVYYAFCLPDNPVVTSVLGRWEPTPPGQQAVRKYSVVGLCREK